MTCSLPLWGRDIGSVASRPGEPKSGAPEEMSAIRRVLLDVARDLALPPVSVVQKPGLVEQKLLTGLDGEFEAWAFHDGVHGAGFLAQPAIDALHHVDVVPGGAAGAGAPGGSRPAGRLCRGAERATAPARGGGRLPPVV